MESSKAKILFVDDDNFLRKVYQSELGDQGYEVVLAADGEEGLEKAKTIDPDLIILDMIMPKKNGFEVLTALQSESNTRDIPVIILSNLGQDDDIKRGLDLGAVDYLVKDNITLSAIVEKINQYIHSKTMSKEARANNHTDEPVQKPTEIPVEQDQEPKV